RTPASPPPSPLSLHDALPISLPGPDQWLLDMATTTVAMGKIFKASISGEPTIPAGWAIAPDGVPTTDTAAAMEGWPMPLGGYKGDRKSTRLNSSHVAISYAVF